jgi:hypothetical protein
MRLNMLSRVLAILVRSSLITVLDRFIDNDLDAENTKALSLILVLK